MLVQCQVSPDQAPLRHMQARLILQELECLGVTHIVGLPDNGSRSLFDLLWHHDNIKVMLVSREGEAFAIASGLLVGGARPLVLIQNTGLFESGDAFRGTAYNMGLPLVALIGVPRFWWSPRGRASGRYRRHFSGAYFGRLADPLHHRDHR